MNRSRVILPLSAFLLILLASTQATAKPREERGQPKPSPILRVLKGVIRTLGDGLVAPRP